MAKINVSMPDELLEQVDELAVQLSDSRSGFVAEATARYVATIQEERARTERREQIDRAIEQARELGAKFSPCDSTASIREDRDRDDRKAGER